MTTATAALAELIESADLAPLAKATYGVPSTMDLGDSHRLKMVIDDDDNYSIDDEDPDVIGQIETVRHSGHPTRPQGFDGAARIIWRDRFDATWWQPPAHIVAMGSASVDDAARWVRGLIDNGYINATLLIEQLCDMGHWHSTQRSTLHGVEFDVGVNLGESGIIHDLASDLIGWLKAQPND